MKGKTFKAAFVLSAVLLLFPSCGGGGGGGGSTGLSSAIAGNLETPYIITKPECHLGSLSPHYTACGVHFSVTNKTRKTMKKLSISCMVYSDMNGSNPFMGNNNIHADFTENIAPGETKILILNLDPYLSVVPSEPFIIDFFFIKRIEFTDGSVYTDYNGTHAVSSY